MDQHNDKSCGFLVEQNYLCSFKNSEKQEQSPLENIWGDISVGY
jgi:hypothetical protein